FYIVRAVKKVTLQNYYPRSIARIESRSKDMNHHHELSGSISATNPISYFQSYGVAASQFPACICETEIANRGQDVRKQLRAQCQHLKLKVISEDVQSSTITPERADAILKCFLKGFATNTARLFPDGSYKTMVGNQIVAIHPSSCLFGKKVEAIMYNEFVFTNRSYARGVSAVQMDWIGEALHA
ncbi:MAG: hypothetical protein Q9187_006234, partial [Circinaria calcarea]